MESTTRLYYTIVGRLSQHQNWVHIRHIYTLGKMLAGLIQSEPVHLTGFHTSKAAPNTPKVRNGALPGGYIPLATQSDFQPTRPHLNYNISSAVRWGE